MSTDFSRRLSSALFSPAKAPEKNTAGLSIISPSVNSTLSPREHIDNLNRTASSPDQYLASFRANYQSQQQQQQSSPKSNSRWGRLRRASSRARSDVLSTTPASKVASENVHDNVNAMELNG